jgi:type III secretion protein R
MYPVGLEMADAAKPVIEKQMEGKESASFRDLMGAAERAKEPLREFLVKHTAVEEREFFLSTARQMLPEEKRAGVSKDDLIVVVPAFTVSELARAFQIGFILFLPFLVIDLIVANVLQALGMMMLSPTTISLPFKLLLFVLLDGWSKLIHGLVLTY